MWADGSCSWGDSASRCSCRWCSPSRGGQGGSPRTSPCWASRSALYIGSTAHLGDVVPLERQGEIMGLFDSTRALGGMLGPVIAGSLAPLLGLRGAFAAMAGVSGIGFLLVLLCCEPRPKGVSR
ncbi:MFS transporter [Candidatus Bipolaricaulota sp. J31]